MKKIIFVFSTLLPLLCFCNYALAATSESCAVCTLLIRGLSTSCPIAGCTDEQIILVMNNMTTKFPTLQASIAKDLVNSYGAQIAYLYNLGYSESAICEEIKICDSEGGGSGSDCCAGCVDTDWGSTSNDGYESRQIASCTSCVCSYTTEYRCAEDWHGSTTDGESGCYECGGLVHDFNGTPLSGVEFYDMNGQIISKSDENGDFGLMCTEGIYIVSSPNKLSSRIMLTNSIDASLTQHQILLSNNMDLELCNNASEYLAGYYCSGVLHIPCPESSDGAPVTSSGITRAQEHACYVPANTPIPDAYGTFKYVSDCHYTE